MARTGTTGRSRRRPWFTRGCTRRARASGDALGFPLEEVADTPGDVDAERAVGEQHSEDVRAEEAARILLEGEAAAVELGVVPVEREDVVREPRAVDAERA